MIVRKDGLAEQDNSMANVIGSFQRLNVSYTPVQGAELYREQLRPPGHCY